MKELYVYQVLGQETARLDAADDSYYIRVDEEGYGKVYYIFSEFLNEFLEDPEKNGYIAGSFTEFLEKMKLTC